MRALTFASLVLTLAGCAVAPEDGAVVEALTVDHRDEVNGGASEQALHEVVRCEVYRFEASWSVQIDREAALAVGWSPGERLAVATVDGRLELMDVVGGGSVRTAATLDVPGITAMVAGTGLALTGDAGGAASLWSTRTGAMLGRVALGNEAIRGVSLSDNGQQAAAVDEQGRLVAWSVSSGFGRDGQTDLDDVSAVQIVGDVLVVVGSDEGLPTIELRDLSALDNVVGRWQGEERGVITSAVATANGILGLGVAEGHGVVVSLEAASGWNGATEDAWGGTVPLQAVALPDGERVVILGTDGALHFVDALDLQELDQVLVGEAMAVGYDPFRGAFATVQSDGSIVGFGC